MDAGVSNKGEVSSKVTDGWFGWLASTYAYPVPFTPPLGPVKRVGVVSVPSVQRVPSFEVAFQPHQVSSKPQPATGDGVSSVGAVPGQVVVVALRATSASASHRIVAPVRGRNAPQLS